jgi:molybdopterin/thiamine biosynthesis adenylyltransferase
MTMSVVADALRLPAAPAFDYRRAFVRNLGLVTPEEQDRLQQARVLIAGAGGVGGVHAVTLARLGIGRLRIVDPDTFELANFNRQIGATMETLGERKADVIARMARAIDPIAEVEARAEALDEDNVDALLHGVDVVLDGLDVFALDARIVLHRAARRQGLTVVSSGPLGMSSTMHVFAPGGCTFEDYYDLRAGMSEVERLAAFLVGTAPRASHGPYMDLRYASLADGYGPSLGAACMLCAGIAAIETLRVVLRRPGLRPAPCYYQFDAYRQRLFRGRLRWGNRGPIQRIKRRLVVRSLLALAGERS